MLITDAQVMRVCTTGWPAMDGLVVKQKYKCKIWLGELVHLEAAGRVSAHGGS